MLCLLRHSISSVSTLFLLTLKVPAKMHLKILSALVVCLIYFLTILTNLSEEANSVDPDQTAPVGAV